MSTHRNIVTNACASWIAQAIQMALVFVVSPILVHGLGDQRYGVWAFVDSVLAYLTLFDLGIGSSVVRYVARFESMKDTERLNRTFSTGLALFIVLGVLVTAITGILIGPLWSILRVPEQLALETRWLLAILGLNLAIGFPLGVFGDVLIGLQRFVPKVAIRTLIAFPQVLVSIFLVKHGYGVISLALNITIWSLISQAIQVVYCFSCLPSLRLSFRLIDRETLLAIRGYSVSAFLAMIAGRITFQTDAIVIGLFLAPEQITYFVIGAKLVEYSKDLFNSVTTVLTPVVSHSDAVGDRTVIRRILIDGSRWMLWISSPLIVGHILLGKSFLGLWISADYMVRSSLVYGLLAIGLILSIPQSVASRVLYGTGKLSFFVIVMIVEAFCNLALSLALVRSYGIVGVACGTLIPNIIANVIVILFVLREEKIRVWVYLRCAILGPLTAALLLAIFWSICLYQGLSHTWLSFLSVGLLGTTLYGGVALLSEVGSNRLMWRLRAMFTGSVFLVDPD